MSDSAVTYRCYVDICGTIWFKAYLPRNRAWLQLSPSAYLPPQTDNPPTLDFSC
jgi:hypothetical protein